MSLFLIGDIHGRINEYLKLLASLPPRSNSIALGDIYLGRPGVHLPELPPEHKFLRGNHDDPALCREHPNYLGDYGYLPDDDLFFVNGAHGRQAGAFSGTRNTGIETKSCRIQT